MVFATSPPAPPAAAVFNVFPSLVAGPAAVNTGFLNRIPAISMEASILLKVSIPYHET
jgi:hypothetical protein